VHDVAIAGQGDLAALSGLRSRELDHADAGREQPQRQPLLVREAALKHPD